MSDIPVKLLFVDDDQVDHLAFKRLVESERLPYRYDLATSVEQAHGLLDAAHYDVVVSDFNLTDGTAFDLFDAVGDTPMIVATGQGDESLAVEALQRGAYDYLTKDAGRGHLRLLSATIDRALQRRRDIVQREQAQRRQRALLIEIEKSHDDLLSILNLLRLGVAMTDEAGRINFLSRACQDILQTDLASCLNKHWEEVCPFSPEDRTRLHEIAARPQDRRAKLFVRLEAAHGGDYAMEIEVQDDPRDARRKIFLMYDVTAVHDLRRLLNKQAHFEGMVGKSAVMQTVFEHIRDLSQLDTTVLVEGETGTGKELVAHAIHMTGHRRDRPFVPLNCAGLTDSLLASQLFGHRRGAFTGAVEDRMGVFESANGGTLFLDEIGDISENVQTSLLRVLEAREIVRIGESHVRKVDVRIIAATHRDLGEQVRRGQFRSDLLYRIRVARVSLPPLRARRNDIPLLADVFLRDVRAGSGRAVREISPEALRLMLDYHWPGNVRELGSAIEFATIRCRETAIQPQDLPPEIMEATRDSGAIPSGQHERERIQAALQQAGGNRTAAARLLGISRATFYRKLQELEISP